MAPASTDAGKVRLGGMAPTLASTDAGKVRLGGMAPTLASTDAGKVRLGGMAPTLASTDAGKVRLGGMARRCPGHAQICGYHLPHDLQLNRWWGETGSVDPVRLTFGPPARMGPLVRHLLAGTGADRSAVGILPARAFRYCKSTATA